MGGSAFLPGSAAFETEHSDFLSDQTEPDAHVTALVTGKRGCEAQV